MADKPYKNTFGGDNPPLKEWDAPGAMHRIARGHPSYRFMEDAARSHLDESMRRHEGRPLTEEDLDKGNAVYDSVRETKEEMGAYKPENYPAFNKGGMVKHGSSTRVSCKRK